MNASLHTEKMMLIVDKDEDECPAGVDRIVTKLVTRLDLRRAIV